MNLISLHLIATASLLSWTFVVANDPPHIEIFPQVQSAFEDEKVAFTCTTGGILNPQFEWRKNGEKLLMYKLLRHYDMADTSKGSVLRILRTWPDDYGTYECIAKNEAGEIFTATSILKNIEHFNFKDMGRLKVNEGHTVRLECYANSTNKAVALWLKDKIRQNMTAPRFSLSDEGKYLEISDFKKEDEGLYSCIALSSDASIYHDVATLYMAESIEMFPPIQTAVNGGTAIFVCTVTPKGNDWQIKWLKNGRNLKSERYQVIDMPKGLVLRIEPVQAQRDEATYECVAKNGAGKVHRRLANLTVQSGNSLPDGYPRFVDHPNVKKGDIKGYVNINCYVTGDPIPVIKWFKDNVPLDVNNSPYTPDSNSLLSNLPSYYGHLEIEVKKESDGGTYECFATNSHGSVMSDKAIFYVAAAPQDCDNDK